jgi:arabinose-5-phosphate isomerase
MTVNAKSIKSTDLVSEALDVLENFAITQLAVIDNGTYKGIIHLHDILKEGLI